jgi:hypothetical protein
MERENEREPPTEPAQVLPAGVPDEILLRAGEPASYERGLITGAIQLPHADQEAALAAYVSSRRAASRKSPGLTMLYRSKTARVL